MRRLIAPAAAALALAGLAACANIGAPPGGPTRTEPPAIVSITPDSGAVNVRASHVAFEFDAVVSDRPAGQASLEAMFVISPRDGTPRVSWERDRIEVRPRRGFRPNTAYSVTLLPGIADLRNNVSRESRTIIFSTGPEIPAFAVRGRAFDWMAERPAVGAIIEVMRHPDSVVFVGVADSLGNFAVGPLGDGRYTATAFLDNNRNRALDPTEAWDSLSVTVSGSSPAIELLAVPRDTVGPRLQTVEVRDSVTLVLNFDRPLDPGVPLTPASFRVVDADSARLVIARVLPRAPSAASADSAPAPMVPPARPDTSRTAMPRPSSPPPTTVATLLLDAATTLRPGTSYRVAAVNARGLLGALRTSDRVITTPRPAPAVTPPPPPP